LPKVDPHLPRSWDEFNKLAIYDKPIEDNILLCNSLSRMWDIIILTGRNEIVRADTEAWLNDNGVRYSQLIMRSLDDDRKDIHTKEEVVKRIGVENILCAFDDLPHVVKHFRSLGITTHQVTEHEDEGRVDLQSHGRDNE
jgi:hypothetical protein